MHRVLRCLDRHHRTMDDARPNEEGNQAQMLIRIASGNEQENAEGCVNRNDHLEIFRPSAGPGPPRWPEDRKWVEAKHSNNTDDAQCEFEVFEAFDFSHRTPQEYGASGSRTACLTHQGNRDRGRREALPTGRLC